MVLCAFCSIFLFAPLCSFKAPHFGLYYSCEYEWQFYWRFSFSSVFPVCQILNQVISETTFQIQAPKMHMLLPDRHYRMQSKLDLSWLSSCLYTVILAFLCINWVFKNSLKNVLFWKKTQTQPKTKQKNHPHNIFIWDAYSYLKFRFLSIYILPGHTFKFLQGNFFHALSKAEWKEFNFFLLFILVAVVFLWNTLLPYLHVSQHVQILHLWPSCDLILPYRVKMTPFFLSYGTPDLNLSNWDAIF